MLVSFSVENWQSFRDRASLSMVASRERQHLSRVPRIGKYKMGLTPVAAVHGGNASGKTNLFKAINFARHFIVKGAQPEAMIAVEPFRLEEDAADKPTRIAFELLADDRCFEFGFRVTPRSVVEEWLTEILKTTEKKLYHRIEGKITFSPELAKDPFLQFAFQGTRDNQLFLTNAVHQRVDRFKPIYTWFRDILIMISPDDRFEQFERFPRENGPLYGEMNVALRRLDTGVHRLSGEVTSFDNLPLPENLKTRLKEEIPEGAAVRLTTESINERFIVTRKNGGLEAKKLVSFHLDSDGSEKRFDIKQESDGVQRAIDLIPTFLDLAAQGSEKVYMIDELDRSLHTLFIRELLGEYLAYCTPESRSQLLFTTHDALLMDQKLFRRDEMWVTERDSMGRSTLFSFSDYKDIRYDKDIRKSYLEGRLGGVPRILFSNAAVQREAVAAERTV